MTAPNLKDTLRLPQTSFPMRGDLVQNEPARLARWESGGLYQRILARRRAAAAPDFILHDGPPFANGDVHMGTALNKLLKDLVLKSKTMAGFAVPFIPGWDCHGLPIDHAPTLARLAPIDHFASRWSLPCGGVYLIHARKQVSPLTPVKPLRRRLRPRLAGVPIASPSANENWSRSSPKWCAPRRPSAGPSPLTCTTGWPSRSPPCTGGWSFCNWIFPQRPARHFQRRSGF